MPSSYSALKLQLMVTGENNTTWGNVTNFNLEALEDAISSSASIPFASADVTLSLIDSNAAQQARAMRLVLTGSTGGAARSLIVPAIQKLYLISNTCADAITVRNASGTGVEVAAGGKTIVYNDGANVSEALTPATPVGALAIANGGTGANNAADARINLAVAKNGLNTDISSLSYASGILIGAPTGGTKGLGTINAQGLFVNGTAVGTGSGTGTVTSVAFSGGTTGLTVTGSPVTTSGTITLGGTLGLANGGTGANTSAAARAALSAAVAGGNNDITSLNALNLGSAAAPSIRTASAGSTGFYFAASAVNVTLGGANTAAFNTTSFQSSVPIQAPAGTLSAPSISFVGDPDTGLYNYAANTIGFTFGGAVKTVVSDTIFQLTQDFSAAKATFSGDLILQSPDTVPTTATSAGTKGTISYDSNYIYVCVATNSWKRAAIAAW